MVWLYNGVVIQWCGCENCDGRNTLRIYIDEEGRPESPL
jgi:hypothetical protein